MQQRKGNFGRKPAAKKGFNNKPVKKSKSTENESIVDLSTIGGYKEKEVKKVVAQPKKKLFTTKASNQNAYCGVYELTGNKSVGITNRLIDRGNVVIHKGQCVMVFETKTPNVVKISTMDGRSAYAPTGCFEKMNFCVSVK